MASKPVIDAKQKLVIKPRQRRNSQSFKKTVVKIKIWIKSLSDLQSLAAEEVLRILQEINDFHQENSFVSYNVTCKTQASEFANVLTNVLTSYSANDPTQWVCIKQCYTIILDFSDSSKEFAASLGEAGLIPIIAKNVGPSTVNSSLSTEQNSFLLNASLVILFNLSKVQSNVQILRDEKINQLLIPHISSEIQYLKAMSMMVLAFTITEEETYLLDEKDIIDYLVQLLKKSLKESGRQMGLSAHELAHSIGLLAVNDNNKTKVDAAGGLPLLISMVDSEDIEEQISATRALWTCAFDKCICAKLATNEKLVKTLNELQEMEELKEATEGILWLMHQLATMEVVGDEALKKSLSKGHIMISYNWDNGYVQNTARLLATMLKRKSYEVWIDVDQMHGSLLEAMAQAVEDSCVVIMCMSEGYKRSNNCRLEAEYAHQKKKLIIPLLMENNYKPDGWLGLMLGSKLYVSFSKEKKYEECFSEVIHQLRQHHILSGSTEAPSSGDIASVVFAWTSEDVQKWLAENSLSSFGEKFYECDGPFLMKLKEIRRDAPEFFYRVLWELDQTTVSRLKDIMNLEEALRKL